MSNNTAGASRYNVRIPSLFEIFFGKLANWYRQLKEWRKKGLLKKALQAMRRRRQMRLETLEPRVLLSADPLAALDLHHPADHDHGAVSVDFLDLDDGVAGDDLQLRVEEAASEDLELDLSAMPQETAALGDDALTLTLDSGSEAIFGMQTVYLSFFGAEDVDYNGPIVVADIDVTAFLAPAGLAGQESEIIAWTLGSLQSGFAGSGISFTLDQPVAGDYSTLYIGGDFTYVGPHTGRGVALSTVTAAASWASWSAKITSSLDRNCRKNSTCSRNKVFMGVDHTSRKPQFKRQNANSPVSPEEIAHG